jgi:hypothetical protein
VSGRRRAPIVGDLSPGAAPPREFQESDGGGPFTPHRLPAPGGPRPLVRQRRTTGREIGRYGVLGRADLATTERAAYRARQPRLGSLRAVVGRGSPPGFRSASGAGGADERRFEPAENRLAVLLQLAEAFGPVERELGGTHALEDLAIAV